jgi:hypothetical protein
MFNFKYSFKRTVLIIYLTTLVGICTYVPWEAYDNEKAVKLPAGHIFIWEQPTYLYLYSDGTKILGQEQLSESAIITKASLASRFPIVGIDYSKIFSKIVAVTFLLGIMLWGGIDKRRRS